MCKPSHVKDGRSPAAARSKAWTRVSSGASRRSQHCPHPTRGLLTSRSFCVSSPAVHAVTQPQESNMKTEKKHPTLPTEQGVPRGTGGSGVAWNPSNHPTPSAQRTGLTLPASHTSAAPPELLEACDLSLIETQGPSTSAAHNKGRSKARQAL